MAVEGEGDLEREGPAFVGSGTIGFSGRGGVNPLNEGFDPSSHKLPFEWNIDQKGKEDSLITDDTQDIAEFTLVPVFPLIEQLRSPLNGTSDPTICHDSSHPNVGHLF